METGLYLKGSRWRKWDLHIHSKYSSENRTKMDIQTIFKRAIENEISVISITDHSNVDGLDEIIKFYNEGIIEINGEKIIVKNRIKFLPGVELKTSSGNKGIHILGIFPNSLKGDILDLKYLRDNLLSPLGITEVKVKTKGNGDYAKGLLKVSVDFKEACKTIKELGGVVIIHSGGKSGSIEKCLAHAKHQTPEEIYNSLGEEKELYMREYVDICEVSSINDAKKNKSFYLNEFNKPTIISSDSHENYEGKKFTWIKANPDMDGLKQIMNEPFYRVLVEKPKEKTDYNVIDKVRYDCQNKNFSNDWIEINENLNTIIGGKSSGKSLLLYCIGKTILKDNMPNNEMKYNLDELGVDNFIVKWKDGTESYLKSDGNSRKITYLPQLYLNNIVEKDKAELDETILSIILEKDKLKESYKNFENKNHNINKDISLKLIDLDENKKIKKSLLKQLLEFQEKKLLNKEIEKIEKKIEADKKTSNLSEAETKEYKELNLTLSKKIEERDEKIEEGHVALRLKEKIGETFNTLIKNLENLEIEMDEMELRKSWKDKIFLNITDYKEELNKESLVLENILKIKEIEKEKKQIEKDINQTQKRLEPIKAKMTNIVLITELEEKLKKQKSILQKREQIEKETKKLEETIETNKIEIIELLQSLKNNYIDMAKEFLKNKEISETNKLELDVNIEFNKEKFQINFNEKLDQRQSLDKIFIDKFEENQFIYKESSFEKDIKEIMDKILSQENLLKLKKGIGEKELIESLFKDYFKFNYDLKQSNDKLRDMSPGKRGLILFQLYLQFSSSEFPILVDQPEDNLDNRTVYNELKDFIVEKKLQRQIIMVTHNANLVVSTDAEEVIVANQSGEVKNIGNKEFRFEYISGALENSFYLPQKKGILYQKGIKEHVCEILEGGEEAFKKRNQKYNII